MENNVAIKFENVSKIYKLNRKDKKVAQGEKKQSFYALKNISFEIPKGRVVGILGTNGSGKSTMATLLAEISTADEGKITVNGEQSLVAINTGLNPQLTGMENIQLKAALLGLNAKKVAEITEKVIEFAEIGDFIYQPIKKYSSGMKSRLGFAISVSLDPDIIIVDEALSVGDKAFSEKCLDKMTELKSEGKTIVFISHSLVQVREFCDSAIWIEGGRLRKYGEIGVVCDEYKKYVDWYNRLPAQRKAQIRDDKYNARLIKNEKKSIWKRILG